MPKSTSNRKAGPVAAHSSGWVYVIHFDSPLSHAKHYVGSTWDVQRRLREHAGNDGSRILEVCNDRDLVWRLVAVYQIAAKFEDCRKAEAAIKRWKNGPELCPLCTRRKKPISFLLSVPFQQFVSKGFHE